MVGGTVSTLFVGWISIGTQVAISKKLLEFKMKDFSVEGCSNSTFDDYSIDPIANLTTTLQNEDRYVNFVCPRKNKIMLSS